MKFLIALDVAEENPALIGYFSNRATAVETATRISADWGNGFEVLPVYETYGEFIRHSEEGHDDVFLQ